MTDEAVQAVEAVANAVSPHAPILKAAEAVVTTIADPSPNTLVSDFELAVQLVDELKAKLSGAHPSIMNIIKALF